MKKIFLLVVLLLTIGTSITFAYFTANASIVGSNGDENLNLSLENGSLSVEVQQLGWTLNNGENIENNLIVDPSTHTADIAKYEVLFKNNSNLTTNVDVFFDLTGKKVGGTTENPELTPEDEETSRPTDNLAESFVVTVGDEDGINDGQGLYAYPEEDDAQGTDCRMVTSGFYNYYMSLKDQAEIVVNVKFIGNTKLDYIYYFDQKNSIGNIVKEPITWNESPPLDYDENTHMYSYTFEDTQSITIILRDWTLPNANQTSNITLSQPGEYTITVNSSDSYSITSETTENQVTMYRYEGTKGWTTDRFEGIANNISHFYSVLSGNNSHNYYNYTGTPLYNDKFGHLINDNGEVFFDGLVQRALNNVDDVIVDGVNWADLQPVEPLVFDYHNNNIAIGENVGSASFQIAINDIQPRPTDDVWLDNDSSKDWHKSFSPKSTVEYDVTLSIVKGSNVLKSVNVPEWETIINSLNQHGLTTDVVTLPFPVRLLEYVEQANAKDATLELLIDDPTFGTDGDAYLIDYAELLVNADIAMNGSVSGTVKEAGTNNPIKNALVTDLSTGISVMTDENGYFKFDKNIAGQVILSLSHPEYRDREYSVNVKEDSVTTVDIEMVKAEESDGMAEREKFTGTVKLERIADETTTLIEQKEFTIKKTCLNSSTLTTECEEIIQDFSFNTFMLEPNEDYKLTYEVHLKNTNDVDPYANDFTLFFDSEFYAMLTQENNKSD